MNLVSIILPSYNGERCLRNAIRSIINQTYQNWELIIVNDCSTDNTLKIAQEFAKQDLRIKIVSNKQNLKLPASLNIGFKLAQGQYYTWTSDDNSFKPEALSTMVKYLTEHRDIDMVCCNYDRIDEDGKNIPKYIIKNEKDIIKFIKGENIGACFLYTKEIAQKVGEYDTAMFCVEDYDYWCRIALAGTIQYLNKNLYTYIFNSKSLSVTRQDIIPDQILKARLKHATTFLNNLNTCKFNKVRILMDCYEESYQKEWMNLAKEISPYFTKILFAKILCVNLKYLIKLFANLYVVRLKKQNIAFWGNSNFLKILFETTLKSNIKYIIDNNEKIWGTKINSCLIVAPEEISKIKPDKIICTIKNQHQKVYPQIQKYLQEKHPEIELSPDIFN